MAASLLKLLATWRNSMELPIEDALDIFRGWRDKTSSVTFFLDGTEALVQIRGVVREVFEGEIMVSNEVSRVRLGLENATFEYQDPREAPPFFIFALGSSVSSLVPPQCLSAKVPAGIA